MEKVVGEDGLERTLCAPEDSLQDLSIQMQCFPHAPTHQAWSIIWELYKQPTTQMHKDFDRQREKIHMFMSGALQQHPDWVVEEEQKHLLSQANARLKWVLSTSGDSQRKLDHIWHAYFGTCDVKYADKVVEIANNLSNGQALRETAVWSYHLIANTAHPNLAERAPAIMKMGDYLHEERYKQQIKSS